MKKIRQLFTTNKMTMILINVALVLLVFFLLIQTFSVWMAILRRLMSILMPFVVGMIIAYLLAPLMRRLERLGVRKSLAILTIVFSIAGLIVVFLFVAVPQIYSLAMEFYHEYSTSDFGIIDFFRDNFGFDMTDLYDSIKVFLADSLTDFRDNFTNNLASFVSQIVSVCVTMIFGVAVALYVLSDHGKFKQAMLRMFGFVNKDAVTYIDTVDINLRRYLNGMLIVMAVRSIEYILIYLAFGSKYCIILGILHGLGVFIPYIGGLFATAVGGISLMLIYQGNWPMILFCVIVMVVAQYVDEYFIAPKILSKRTQINPLWIIFAVFAGGTLLGVLGILIAVPTFIVISVAVKTYFKLKAEQQEAQAAIPIEAQTQPE